MGKVPGYGGRKEMKVLFVNTWEERSEDQNHYHPINLFNVHDFEFSLYG